jgi:Flp pilus assembly protein TadB
VITDAEQSQDDQLHSREVRYVLMMSFRAVCVVAAAILVGTHAPLLWIWIPICLVGMVAVPWLAVILANDRPPRRRTPPSAQLPGPSVEESTALPAATPIRVIDADDF